MPLVVLQALAPNHHLQMGVVKVGTLITHIVRLGADGSFTSV